MPTSTATPDIVTGSASSQDAPGESSGKVNLPVITFDQGLPGFPEARRFVVIPMEENLRPFCRMMSLDQEGLQFVVVPPVPLFADYQIEIDEDTVDRLDFKDASDVIALLIVDPKSPPEAPTANLLAPVVFNRRTFAASQVVLHGSQYSATTQLPRPQASPSNS